MTWVHGSVRVGTEAIARSPMPSTCSSNHAVRAHISICSVGGSGRAGIPGERIRMSTYQYNPLEDAEIRRCLRGVIPPHMSIKQASLTEDFGGIDAHWVVNQRVPLQVRVRRNRPPYAADIDVTFRTTEPAMMAAETYAPLAVFMWFVDGHVAAAKVVDVYRMFKHLDPPLATRFAQENGDGTGFHVVTIVELVAVRAMLRQYDGQVWNTPILGGEMQLNRILDRYMKKSA